MGVPSPSAAMPDDAPPLCVDLDGTLVLSDLFFESLLLLARRQPMMLLLVPFWLLRGRAALKAQVAARAAPQVETLPYNDALIRWLESERRSGRSLWLCTAAHETLAASVADHLKLFDGVLASTRSVNLSGANKAARLIEQFGEGRFDYCGNERLDIEVWRWARGAIVVSDNDSLQREVARHAVVVRTFSCPRFVTLRAMIRSRPAARLKQ
jgi:hypothetical protein